MNVLEIMYLSLGIFVAVKFGLVNVFNKYLPNVVRRTFTFGRFTEGAKTAFAPEVPKAWFPHYYIFAVLVGTPCFGFLCRAYFFAVPPPMWLISFLNVFGGDDRKPTGSSMHYLLAITLFTMQCLRRFHDTQRISVYNKETRLPLSYYILGFVHYAGVFLALLIEAPHFSKPSSVYDSLKLSELTLVDYAATSLFAWSWYHQYTATVILANLRKNNKGEVVSHKYELPKGDLFELLSSPHETTEILMYFSLSLILWNNFTTYIIFLWVLTNQIEGILLSHWWYQKKFEDFPSTRKALIPFLY